MNLKSAAISLFFVLTSLFVNAKDVTVYKTLIYTSEDLADDIQKVNDSQDDTRRFDIDLLNATLGAAKGIGAGYISSFVDLGVNALGNLITPNARQKKEWEDMVKEENTSSRVKANWKHSLWRKTTSEITQKKSPKNQT